MKGYFMKYELKDKINTTKELLNELEMKGWQEIEHLQAQIANLAEGSVNDRLRQLLKNLLTSYYVFAGGIEALEGESAETHCSEPVELKPEEQIPDEIMPDEHELLTTIDDFTAEDEVNYKVSEPFEYFVDFDEPAGEPISDEDLYGN